MIQLEHEYKIPLEVLVAGVGTAADSTPTAVLYRNGSASGVSVTVTTTAITGLYFATFTTLAVGDGWAKTDVLQLIASATIDSVSNYIGVVWDSTGDVDAVMRGTDDANTTTPPTAAANATAVRTELETELTTISEIPASLTDLLSLIEGIAITGLATFVAADAYTLTTGNLSSGTLADTATADGTNHVHTDQAGAIEVQYTYEMGVGEVGVELLFRGRVDGANDAIAVQVYDWVGATWNTLWTQQGAGGTVVTNRAEPLLIKHTGINGNDGEVRIRFYAAAGLSSATLYVDLLLVAKAITQFNLSDGTIDDIRDGLALEATLTSMSGATFDTATDSLEAIRNRGDDAWSGGGESAPSPQEIAEELEREDGPLYLLYRMFDGIDKIIKWLRK